MIIKEGAKGDLINEDVYQSIRTLANLKKDNKLQIKGYVYLCMLPYWQYIEPGNLVCHLSLLSSPPLI